MIKWDIYKAKDGWRWRAWRGAKIVADSGEAYTTRAGARRAIVRFIGAILAGKSVQGAPRRNGRTK